MSDYAAAVHEPSLSLPIRLEKKRKRTRVGMVAVGLGVVALGIGGYNFLDAGAVLIGIYMTVFALALIGFGVSRLRPSKDE